MLPKLKITIDGTPQGKGRPKFGSHGAYTPKETEVAEAYIRGLGVKAMQGRPPTLGPIRITIDAIFEAPQSWPRRMKEMADNGHLPHMGKPDADNILKLVLDALNGIIWRDDAQICEFAGRARYGLAERVEVLIEELATSCDHPAMKNARKRVEEEILNPKPKIKRRTQRNIARPSKSEFIGRRIK